MSSQTQPQNVQVASLTIFNSEEASFLEVDSVAMIETLHGVDGSQTHHRRTALSFGVPPNVCVRIPNRLIIAASSRFHEDEMDCLEASLPVSALLKRSNSPGLGGSETPFFDVFRSELQWVPWLGDKPIRLGK